MKPTVNLLDASHRSLPPSPPPKPPRPPRRRRGALLTSGAMVLVLAAVFVTANIVIPGARLSQRLGSSGLFSQLRHLTFSGDRTLTGEVDDRINILLLGIGGAGHDGPLLADTVIVASIKPSTKQVSLVSLPRDLVIPYPDGSWRKLNEIYIAGRRDKAADPGVAAGQTLGSVLGISLPYYVLADFSGFEEIIDAVGGVNVYVDRSFTDPLFPVPGASKAAVYNDRFQRLTFTQGWQHFDGTLALAFARSRHGNNGEGSDFARAARQQKILLALKDRVLQANVLLNPVTINRLTGELAENITTNVEPWQALRLYQHVKDVNTEHVIRATVDDGPGGLLAAEINSDGAYVLRPRGGSFDQLQDVVRTVFNTDELVQEPARVEILNGTKTGGLASETADLLTARGYSIVRIGNADEQTHEETVIHDFTNGTRPTSLAALRLLLDATVVVAVPDWLVPTASAVDPQAATFQAPPKPTSGADFVVIVGQDRTR